MDKLNKAKNPKTSNKESEEIENLDNELKDLIENNESLKLGMTKIFKEIKKNN